MIITQTFTMARWQIAVKTSEATKQRKTKMTTTTTTTTKNGRRGWGLKKQLTEWSSDVVIIIDLRETNFRFEAVKISPHNIQTILACGK